MSKQPFPIGTRVRAVKGCANFYAAGAEGVVIACETDGDGLWVHFDKGPFNHCQDHVNTPKKGWFGFSDYFVAI